MFTNIHTYVVDILYWKYSTKLRLYLVKHFYFFFKFSFKLVLKCFYIQKKKVKLYVLQFRSWFFVSV